ncbi:alkaline phosphatase family protein [Novosphingobium terrae]|uniref:alkaline phosphatase family protein n=1 Tax=Novosphingobium terrae TaxID=2726189 RepID=UPI00197E7227|nr:alkaline phosphatase family protein [Novosphingobium terrae]
MAKDVIVLEFNELTPSVVDRLIALGKLPNFAKLRSQSIVAITDAEEAPPALEPWIQWVTVHTGLSYAEHKVFDLGDGPRLKEPRIWDMVSDAGRKAWICGSMNAAVQGGSFNGMVLPDPWATDIKPQPAGLFDPYLDVVRTYVQEYTTNRPGVSKSKMLRFMRFMAGNGLSSRTMLETIRQLVGELSKPIHWRRATILDRLQWDIFRRFYRTERPALSTFFLNSTAHFQHYFWRNFEPQAFSVNSDAETQKKYAEAIPYGYQKMDEIIGEARALAGPETSIVLCTALSQQPMLDHEDIGGKQIFKMHNQDKLFAFAGVPEGYTYAPVMAEQFHLIYDTEAEAQKAVERLRGVKLPDGTSVMMARCEGSRVFSGCDLVTHPAASAKITSTASNETPAFDAMFYPVEAVRSGMHHADGMLWICTPEHMHTVVERRVSLREIAPTLLTLADIPVGNSFALPPMPELEWVNPAISQAA